MKYVDAEHLKVNIEKHIKEVKDAAERFTPNMGFFDAKLSGIYDVMAIIDSLQQEQQEEPDKSLEEAAEEYIKNGRYLPEAFFVRPAFIAGAEWQASQMPMPEDTVLFQKGVAEGRRLMMEEAVEGTVNQNGILELSNGEAIDVCPSLDKCALGLQLGEKVKLIIVKDHDTE